MVFFTVYAETLEPTPDTFTHTELHFTTKNSIHNPENRYLIKYLHQDRSLVLMVFAIVSATGPTMGVVFGGWFVDHMGGYKGKEGQARTAKILFTFALLAVANAMPAAFIPHIAAVGVFVWFVLFFGGAIMPAATGLVISAVPDSMRAFSSAMSQMVFNTLGYGAGSFLPGLLMQKIKEAKGWESQLPLDLKNRSEYVYSIVTLATLVTLVTRVCVFVYVLVYVYDVMCPCS